MAHPITRRQIRILVQERDSVLKIGIGTGFHPFLCVCSVNIFFHRTTVATNEGIPLDRDPNPYPQSKLTTLALIQLVFCP